MSPPVSKTGGDLTNLAAERRSADFGEVGLHWFTGSFPRRHFDDVLGFFAGIFNPPLAGGGGKFYTASYRFDTGVALYFDHPDSTNIKSHCTLEIPGSVLLAWPADDLCGLLAVLAAFEIRCCRLDLFFDDFDWIVTPQQVLEVCDQGDFALYRKFEAREIRERLNGEIVRHGMTVQLGVRGGNGSGRFGRIYDKRAESKGLVDAVRWECELSDLIARETFKRLVKCTSMDDLAITIGNVLGGCFDFPMRAGGDPNIARLPRYEWWLSILDRIGCCRVIAQRPQSSMLRTKEWLERIAPTFAAMKLYLGAQVRSLEGFIQHLAQTGLEKLPTERAKRAIAEGRRDGAVPI